MKITPVHIAGIGAITGMGNNVEACLNALTSGHIGIGEMQRLSSVHKGVLPVAEVKLSNEELADILQLPAHISRTALLSAIAAKEAVTNAGIALQPWRTGFFSANTVGGMDKTEDFYGDFLKNPLSGKLRNVVNHECGAVTNIVADYIGIKNFVSTISTACSSSANAIFLAARMIRNNMLDIAIAGGVDALTKFTLNGFNTLMILDQQLCQPFDENRRGLNLGEGAAYVVLVSDKVAKTLQANTGVSLTGYSNANDAYHQTASSPEGAGSFAAMQVALKTAGLQPEDVDYINLHGTGTNNNDIAEGTAVKKLFAGKYPYMSSTKSFTGHTLGASGAIEAVFSVLAIQHGLVFPNLRWQTQMETLPFAPTTTLLRDVNIKHVLSNSFGFGGNCSSLVFSKD